MSDVTELTQLVLHERQGRDRGWWDQMAAAFAPGARVRLSWIDGTAEEFVAGSRSMSESGATATHRMGPPVVRIRTDRALVEAPAVIELRTALHGVEVDLGSRVRLLYRASRRDGRWLLESLDCIYENDFITPTTPGLVPDVDGRELASLRPSYRWLAYVLSLTGHAVADDLPGEDRPADITRLYAESAKWLDGERNAP